MLRPIVRWLLLKNFKYYLDGVEKPTLEEISRPFQGWGIALGECGALGQSPKVFGEVKEGETPPYKLKV